ncbi:sporulation protein [Luedemannella flava]
MVFKKLLASLGLGGVDVDTVLPPHPATAGGHLGGQVNLRAKSDTDIAAINLYLVASGPAGEVELARFPVAGGIHLAAGSQQQVPFSVPLPDYTPFTVLYGQNLPGIRLGVRTEVAVASGSAKGDFDPLGVEAAEAHQRVMDTLGLIGCRFARNELRPGQLSGLPVAAAQAITFWAPVPDGQRPGPHIPQLTFTLIGGNAGLTVLAELAAGPGTPDRYVLSADDITRLSNTEGGWSGEVDRWLVNALVKLNQAPAAGVGAGAFLQQQGHHGTGTPITATTTTSTPVTTASRPWPAPSRWVSAAPRWASSAA